VTLAGFEVGIVSASRNLVDFLAHVFELEELPSSDTPVGVLHRLASPGAQLKVMVPNEPPRPAGGEPFLAATGIRYLTMAVTDLDSVVERCTGRGGTLVFGPFDYEPGIRMAVITDPDGNTIEVVQAGTAE
jgi:catechol 2,3-dioxygenase-like lactoylglutathione lyase family enzyme